VRASAVSALAKFGIKLDHLRPSIIVLLRRCLHDNDDEVRDRATFYLSILESKDAQYGAKLITDVDLGLPLANLEAALQDYVKNPSATPFDVTVVSSEEIDQPKPTKDRETARPQPTTTPAAGGAAAPAESANTYADQLAQIPQFATFGRLYKTSPAVELTESETEYVVSCVKHIFPEHIVFQFNVTNTISEQQLEHVTVKMEPQGGKFRVQGSVPAPVLQYQVPGTTYVAVQYPKGAHPTAAFNNTLKFTVKEVDTSTGDVEESGFEDDYQIEEVEVTMADYIKKVVTTSFPEDWEALGDENEAIETFNLSTIKTLQDAVKEISGFLGMQPVDRSETVPPKKTKHVLYLSGRFVGDVQVLARARMKQLEQGGVAMELTVRSPNGDLSTALATAI
jgi:coatomer protein complex subunit gamma